MPIKILGAGLGRTGTYSLKLALEKLGFGPCHHMSETGSNVAHIDAWNNATDGMEVNWQVLFQGYQAAVDWPTVSFLPQLVNEYPRAKVILTLRNPEQWYESARDTIFRLSVLGELASNVEEKRRSKLSEQLILERFFSGRYNEKHYCIAKYDRHVESVRKLIKPANLLEYDVIDGWQPLCEFLDVSVPEEPFPVTNTRSSFISRQVRGKSESVHF